MFKCFSGSGLLKTVLLSLFVSAGLACAASSSASAVPPVILFIGDSHSTGSFGMQQDVLLRSVKSFRVETYAICGSSTDNWFLGDNVLNQVVYDQTTDGCYDGIGEKFINLNQGAESTISYLLARLSFEK